MHYQAITRIPFLVAIQQGLRYLGVGLVTFPVGVGVTVLAHEVLKLSEEMATSMALTVLLILGFILTREFTFKSKGHIRHQACKFLFIAMLMRGIEYILFLAFFSVFTINYIISLVLALGISFTAKFFLYRNWIFNDVNLGTEHRN